MPRKKLPRSLKRCEREGCNNTFIVKVGGKYQQRFCSPSCAALANSKNRKPRRRKSRNISLRRDEVKSTYSLTDLQEMPVNFISNNGGKFAEICNRILEGEYQFV